MKDSPTLRLAVELWLAAIGVTGFPAKILSAVATFVVGSMMDKVIKSIDIKTDTLKQAMKDPVWRERATALYAKASAKVYSEEEKDAIRKEYLKALGDYASVHDRLR